DEARLQIDLHNIEGVAGPLNVTVEQESPSGLWSTVHQRAVTLAPNERTAEHVSIKPQELGRVAYHVTLAGPGDLKVRRRLTFDVKPPAGDIRRVTVSELAPGGSITL